MTPRPDPLATLRQAVYANRPVHGLERDHDNHDWLIEQALKALADVERLVEAARELDDLYRHESWSQNHPYIKLRAALAPFKEES